MRALLFSFSAVVLGAAQATAPPASISGRVKDAYGAVLPTGIISIGTLGFRDGRRTFIPSTAVTTQFDGFGNYRLTPVGPGEYYVRVEAGVLRGIPTYYPGTLDIDAATAIAVQAGHEVVGIDFDVINSPTFKVSGTLLNVPARVGTNGQPDTSILGFTFSSADPRVPDSGAPLLQTTRRAAGEFEINLPAGMWDIFPVIPLRPATAPAPAALGPPTYATGRARVLVKDRDVGNVELTVTSADIRGRLVISGSSPTENNGLSVTRIGLSPRENYPSPLLSHLRSVPLGSSGEFVFDDVPPGRYAFQISPMPEGLYVSDLRVGVKSFYNDGVLDVVADPIDPVEIVLSRGGGTVRVAVTGTIVETSNQTNIALVPAAPRRGNALLYKTLSPEAPGLAVFKNVPPGRYKAFAFQSLPPGGAEQNAEFMANYEDFGATIDITAGQTANVSVNWIPSLKP